MAAPYTSVSVTNYNANPPPDDASEVPANRVDWAKPKEKLTDPLKTALESINTNIGTAFGKVIGGAGVTSTAISYSIAAADQGKLVVATGAGITLTTPDATTVTSPFVVGFLNNSSGSITIDGNGSQTIDGAASIVVPSGFGGMLFTNGTNWFTTGQNFVTAQPKPGARALLILRNSGTPTTQIDVTASEVITQTTAGVSYRSTTVSVTINAATTGANGLDTGGLANTTYYSVWIIYNPTTGTTAGLLSTSATNPTMPSGYTAKVRLGWVITNGSAQFVATRQVGNKAQYIASPLPLLSNGAVGTFTSGSSVVYASASLAVPSTAVEAIITVTNTYGGGTIASIAVAPTTSYGPPNSTTDPPLVSLQTSSAVITTVSFVIESGNIGIVSNNAGGAVMQRGWVDNI